MFGGRNTMISKKKFYEKGIVLACILCNISQIPELMQNRVVSIGYTVCWVLLAVLLFFNNRLINIRYFLLPVIFDLFCVIGSLLWGGYLNSNLFRPINLCTFILLIGTWAGEYLDYGSLKNISQAYIASALLVAINLYLNLFRGVDWANTGYLYGSKNSAGQIFLVASILLIIFFWKKKIIVSSILIVFFASLIFMMKSRASIITLLIAIVYLVVGGLKKSSHKMIGVLIIGIVIVSVLQNDSLYDLFINEIMLNNRDVSDITAVTSNRDEHLERFIKLFPTYCLWGNGGAYLESFPLAALLSYGVMGGIPILLYSLFPLWVAIKNVKIEQYRIFCIVIIALNLIMWINGIFEEQSPFGPGVKCFYLWLVTGLFLGYKRRKEVCVKNGRSENEYN